MLTQKKLILNHYCNLLLEDSGSFLFMSPSPANPTTKKAWEKGEVPDVNSRYDNYDLVKRVVTRSGVEDFFHATEPFEVTGKHFEDPLRFTAHDITMKKFIDKFAPHLSKLNHRSLFFLHSFHIPTKYGVTGSGIIQYTNPHKYAPTSVRTDNLGKVPPLTGPILPQGQDDSGQRYQDIGGTEELQKKDEKWNTFDVTHGNLTVDTQPYDYGPRRTHLVQLLHDPETEGEHLPFMVINRGRVASDQKAEKPYLHVRIPYEKAHRILPVYTFNKNNKTGGNGIMHKMFDTTLDDIYKSLV